MWFKESFGFYTERYENILHCFYGYRNHLWANMCAFLLKYYFVLFLIYLTKCFKCISVNLMVEFILLFFILMRLLLFKRKKSIQSFLLILPVTFLSIPAYIQQRQGLLKGNCRSIICFTFKDHTGFADQYIVSLSCVCVCVCVCVCDRERERERERENGGNWTSINFPPICISPFQWTQSTFLHTFRFIHLYFEWTDRFSLCNSQLQQNEAEFPLDVLLPLFPVMGGTFSYVSRNLTYL